MKKRENKHRIEVVILVFLLAFGFFLAINPTTYTSFVTLQHVNPELSISLSKNAYDSNEIIDGNITIKFKGPININTNLSIKFNGFEYKQNIKDVFFQLGKTFSSTEDEIKAINPSDSKVLIYTGADKRLLGFKLPFDTFVNSIDMNIFSEAIDGSYPSSLSFDIGDDEIIEWRYLGDFSSFKDNYAQPNTLDLSVTPASTILDNNIVYHCSLLNLPFSRDFEITANYRLFNSTSTEGNIKAAIMEYDSFGNQFINTNNVCDLPEPATTFAWNSCNIKLSNAIEGEFLVCLYNENSKGSYRIATDFSSSQSTFQCDINIASCEQKEFFDYFIRVRGANYNAVFTEPIKLSQVNISMNLLIESLQNEIAICEISEDNLCIIPVSVSSGAKGKVALTDLIIDIGGIEYNIFYELITIPGVIYDVNRVPIDNTSLSLSLKSFNFTLDNESKILEIALEPGAIVTEEVKLFEIDATSLEDEISNIEAELNKIKDNEFIRYLDYDIDNSFLKISQYKNELSLLSNFSGSILESRTNELRNEINLFKNSIPKDIKEKEIVKDIIVVEPNDLDNVVGANEKASVYDLQNKIDVKVEATVIEATNVKKTIVKKIVTPKENLNNVFLYEKIPKSIANNIDKVKLFDDFEVVERDPLIRKKFSALTKNTPIEFTYALDGEFINNVFGLKTLIVPLDIEVTTEEKEMYECGDNICSIPFEDEISCPVDCKTTRIPWILLIIGIIIILFGALYFNFYRGKLDFRTLTRGKNPFKTKNDLENVKKFIKNSLNRNIDKKNITKTLLQKGWNKKQIKYVFEEVEWEQKWVLIKIEAPETDKGVKVLKKYISRCRKVRMDDNRIRNILLNKGWTDEQIIEGFKRAKGWF